MDKNHTAIVHKFNQQKVCTIAAVGSPKSHYDSTEVYWIERSEDEYGLMNLPKNVTAILWREDWLRGRAVVRLAVDRAWSEYPIGTKAHAYNGGYWIKVANGWKWCNGSTFPTPGADAIGECIELPV